MDLIILIAWAGTCLGWFVPLLRRRLQAPELAGMPIQARLHRLGLGIFALPFLLLLVGNSAHYSGLWPLM